MQLKLFFRKKDNRMKLIDLHTLSEQTIGYVVDLYEVMNTTADIDWKIEIIEGKQVCCGYFTLDDKFRILIEPFKYLNTNCLNLAFQIWNNQVKGWSVKPTNTNKNASKIIGIVKNALAGKIKEFDTDVIVFFASDNIDTRMNIYNNLASIILKDFGHIRENIELSDGKLVTIITNGSVTLNDEFLKLLDTIDLK